MQNDRVEGEGVLKGAVNQAQADCRTSWEITTFSGFRWALCVGFDLMRQVKVAREPRLRPLSALALAATVILSTAILYNVFLGQPGRPRFVASQDTVNGASTRVDVVAPLARQDTIVMKYDPRVEEVQRSLLKTGDYQGMVDGVQGKRTRLAIESYQRKAGLAVDGEISSELIDHIHYTQKIAAAADFTGSVSPVEAEPGVAAQMRQLQTGLAELGYAPGEITGELTAATVAAILQFEKDRGLDQDGDFSPELLDEIAKMSGDTAMAAP
jgi:peptidoglycan hydrolase-like protein with peptidoglycan-binding domain